MAEGAGGSSTHYGHKATPEENGSEVHKNVNLERLALPPVANNIAQQQLPVNKRLEMAG